MPDPSATAAAPGPSSPAEPSPGPPGAGQIIRQREPENLEFAFPGLAGFLTPNPQFYVRCHFPKPQAGPAPWRLRVEGRVRRATELTLDELTAMPARTRPVTLECAGNGRVFLSPKVDGAQWELGAVSTAEWEGVPLADVLDRAGLGPGAAEVILEGADEGEPDEKPRPPGKIHYSHAVPLAKAPDVLLARRMNGRPLPPAHGFPLRAVVGGWYGMASVKWLRRIVVTDRPFRGYFQTVDYAHWLRQDGMPVRVPITEMRVKSQIARPALHEVVPRAGEYRVFGAAWAGDADVAKVEVSTDGGKGYAPATLLGEPVRHAWRLWEFVWKTPATPGLYTLMSRATDDRGRQQPAERDRDLGNYVVCHTLPVEVEVA